MLCQKITVSFSSPKLYFEFYFNVPQLFFFFSSVNTALNKTHKEKTHRTEIGLKLPFHTQLWYNMVGY